MCFETDAYSTGVCTNKPCKNGGECQVAVDDPDGYVCKCTSAKYFGKTCARKCNCTYLSVSLSS